MNGGLEDGSSRVLAVGADGVGAIRLEGASCSTDAPASVEAEHAREFTLATRDDWRQGLARRLRRATNVELGKKILNESGLAVIAADDLADAAEKIVKAVKGA